MSEPQPPPAPASQPPSRTFEVMSFLFGVALPLIRLGVELTSGLNSQVFFDPLGYLEWTLVFRNDSDIPAEHTHRSRCRRAPW